ncbi:MAG: hypothetical protein BWY83_02442 [bacterium ADurb.Bin478]|nr:MAG: hypothetical protein BWY83_02442 [bacterium ADurb.Bin478]
MELARIQSDGHQPGKRPEKHEKAFEEHAAENAEAGGPFILGRSGGSEQGCGGDDRDQVGQHHGKNRVPGVFTHLDGAKNVEHVIRHRGMQSGESADARQAQRNEHDRKDDDQHSLNRIGEGRGDQTSQHRVYADQGGKDKIKGDRIGVRDHGFELIPLIHIVENLIAGFFRVGHGQRFFHLLSQIHVLMKIFNRLFLLDRIGGGRLRRQRHHGFSGDHVSGSAADHRHHQRERGKRGAQSAALITLRVEIAQGDDA